MSTLAIFIFGFLVITIVLIATSLVGLSEASDPAHSRLSDLTILERSLVDRADEEAENRMDASNHPDGAA
jgi:hypothetical protein